MNWFALAWILGGLVTMSTFSIILRARISEVGRGVLAVMVSLAILAFVVPMKNPLTIFLCLLVINAGVRPLLMHSGSILLTLGSLLASIAVVGAASFLVTPDTFEYSGNLVADIQVNVAKRWEKIVSESGLVVDKIAKDTRPVTKSKPPTRGMRRQLERVRELLLPVDCHDILAAVDELDGRIAATQMEIVKAEGDRISHPEAAGKFDARIEAVKEKKANFEAERAKQAGKVIENLRKIGLNLPGNAAERCIFPVNVETLIDNAIVAKDIAVVVENLGHFVDSKDISTARRYFGMYLVMIDVQIEGYRKYLQKSENGEWSKGINGILRKAESAMKSDTAKAAQTRFDEKQRETFRKNAERNAKTIEAAKAYLDLLKQHEEIIRGKLLEAERVREVVHSSWITVNLASELMATIKTSQEAFEAMLSLELPPLELFDDEALQAQFNDITRQLRKD